MSETEEQPQFDPKLKTGKAHFLELSQEPEALGRDLNLHVDEDFQQQFVALQKVEVGYKAQNEMVKNEFFNDLVEILKSISLQECFVQLAMYDFNRSGLPVSPYFQFYDMLADLKAFTYENYGVSLNNIERAFENSKHFLEALETHPEVLLTHLRNLKVVYPEKFRAGKELDLKNFEKIINRHLKSLYVSNKDLEFLEALSYAKEVGFEIDPSVTEHEDFKEVLRTGPLKALKSLNDKDFYSFCNWAARIQTATGDSANIYVSLEAWDACVKELAESLSKKPSPVNLFNFLEKARNLKYLQVGKGGSSINI